MKTSKQFLLALFFTAFIDMLGIGIIIPVIPALFFKQGIAPFGGLIGADTIRWVYCLLMASYSGMMFFGAPILGSLSDQYGRRKILLIAIVGQAIGYSLFGIALHFDSITLLFLSRLIPGFFGGSLSVIFSAISDVSTPQQKPQNFALVGVAFALGFILGPFLGGVLSSSDVCTYFELSTPFVLATFLSILNFIFIYKIMRETLQVPKKSSFSIFKGIQNVRKAMTSSSLRILFSISFLYTLGFSFYTQFFSVFMYNQYHVSQKTVGFVFAWVGIWMIFTQGFLVRKINKAYSSATIVSFTMIQLAVSIFMILYTKNIGHILLLNIITALSQGLNSPNLLNLVSKQANAEQQGEILGINQSIQSLAQFLPSIFVAIFGENINSVPFIFSATSILLAWSIFSFFYKSKNET